MTAWWERSRALLGSQSALSAPVIIGFGITGFVVTVLLIGLTLRQPWLLATVVAVITAALSSAVLTAVSVATAGRPWPSPRLGLVVLSFVLASLVRSVANQALIAWLAPNAVISGNPGGRTIASLVITTGITLGIAGVVQLSREQSNAIATLLTEQQRLRHLAGSMDEELARSELELRARARELLDPTIAEISALLRGEISSEAAVQVSARITRAVSDVVRPTSRELALADAITIEDSVSVAPTRLHPWTDRMDVTTAIHPVWVLVLCWLIIVPVLLFVPVFASTIQSVIGVWVVASVAFGLFLALLRRWWPAKWRDMRVASGLILLTGIYLAFNLIVQWWIGSQIPELTATDSWERASGIGLALKVGMAMIVSIVAMLAEHAHQSRLALQEVNLELEGLVARLRRETWLLHRSVSLAVHGPLQSALVSTAMRLSSADRTEESVADARRRLDAALLTLEQDRREVPGIDEALADLRGLWQPVVRVRADLDETSARRLDADAGLRQCVIEICREATSNAIRHGQASEVAITIESSAEVVALRVLDNGQGVTNDAIPGLGSAMLDETCLRWSLADHDGGGAALTAVLV